MAIKAVEVGYMTVYGDWSDTHGYQFIVAWGEAGNYCDVLLLGGTDYGGGVTIGSTKVLHKELSALIDAADKMLPIDNPESELYKAVEKLVAESGKVEGL